MARAMNSNSENVSANLQSSYGVDEIEIGESASFECYADKLAFKCVWQHPDVNMQIINQFMEQINIYDSNEFGDQTPSNIMELLSSSFPSGIVEDLPAVDEQSKQKAHEEVTFYSSTPLHKGSDYFSSAKRKNDKLAFQDFNDASPILTQKVQRKVLTKKRLQMSLELEDELENSKKIMKT